jgi:hypothetical protein
MVIHEALAAAVQSPVAFKVMDAVWPDAAILRVVGDTVSICSAGTYASCEMVSLEVTVLLPFPVKVTVALRASPLLACTVIFITAPLLETPPLVTLTVAQSESDSAVQLQLVVTVKSATPPDAVKDILEGESVTEAASCCWPWLFVSGSLQETSNDTAAKAVTIKYLSFMAKQLL